MLVRIQEARKCEQEILIMFLIHVFSCGVIHVVMGHRCRTAAVGGPCPLAATTGTAATAFQSEQRGWQRALCMWAAALHTSLCQGRPRRRCMRLSPLRARPPPHTRPRGPQDVRSRLGPWPHMMVGIYCCRMPRPPPGPPAACRGLAAPPLLPLPPVHAAQQPPLHPLHQGRATTRSV